MAQIVASRGVPASTPTTALLHHSQDDLNRAEHDQTLSPAAADALLGALRVSLANR